MKKEELLGKWETDTISKVLAKTPERKIRFTTPSGVPVERVYVPDTIDGAYAAKLSLPGQYPYTRGVQPTMYRGRFWTMRQYAGFSTAEESNKRYRYLLSQGTTGLSVAFDLPTQIGYDSDDAMAAGEVGKVGVAIDSLADMEILLDQIPLDKISTSMTINATASILLAMYAAIGEKQGVPLAALTGTIQNDILKEYIARGTYIFPPKPSLRLITDIFAWCSREMPQFNTISISGYHIREAGSNAVQEVAFTLANACAYVQAAMDADLDIDVFGKRLAFFFNCSSDFFEEIAKFRAARRMWARLMKERFKAKNPSSQMLRFHTQTSGYTLAAQQIDNNVVRVALQALASVLGGTQSLHTNSRDEAIGLPTEESVRTALRTQQIIAYESGTCDTVDPLAGSYYLESLTDRIESEALALMDKIESMGGVVSAIESGFIQRQIENSAYQFQQQIEAGERIIVGVNKFQSTEAQRAPVFRIDETVEERQVEKLKKLKAHRDGRRVTESLEALKAACLGTENLMQPIMNAVKSYATLGEIAGVMRSVFGEYQEGAAK